MDVCLFCYLRGGTAGVVQEESDALAAGKVLGHVVVNWFQIG